MNWYVMNVFNNWEKKVKEAIEKEVGDRNLSKCLGRIIIPKEKVVEIRRGKKINVERSYYPGYMMLECDMNGELLKIIRNVNGVVSFLGSKDRPIPMSEREVKHMLLKIENVEELDVISYVFGFKEGDKIKIIDGPFNTMSAIVKEILPEKKKLKVEVSIFNRITSLELDVEQVSV